MDNIAADTGRTKTSLALVLKFHSVRSLHTVLTAYDGHACKPRPVYFVASGRRPACNYLDFHQRVKTKSSSKL